MAMIDAVMQTIVSLVELVVHVAVRSFGLPEVKVKILEIIVGWSLAFIGVAGLFYITFKYS